MIVRPPSDSTSQTCVPGSAATTLRIAEIDIAENAVDRPSAKVARG